MSAASAYVRVSSRAPGRLHPAGGHRAAAVARGDTVGCVVRRDEKREDHGARGASAPADDARYGQARGRKTVYVFKLDRLVRSGVADTFAVVDELRRAGVTSIAVADNLKIVPDKEDVTSEVLIFALGLAARLERTAIGERISAARERVEAEGGRWGRPRRVDTPTLERARVMRAEGRTVRENRGGAQIFPGSTIAGALAASEKPGPQGPPTRDRDMGVQQVPTSSVLTGREGGAVEDAGGYSRARGPIPRGSYRVVVIESDGRVTHMDLATFEKAQAYANEAASEAESSTPPVAHVFDQEFRLVHEGCPWWLGSWE